MKRMRSMKRLVYAVQVLLLIWGWAASAQVIDFEDLPASFWGAPATVNVTTQYVTQGITFSAQSPPIVALDYANPFLPQFQNFAPSGTNGIETCYAVQSCTHPFAMSFVQPQTRVKI